jgi:hypothetical protein
MIGGIRSHNLRSLYSEEWIAGALWSFSSDRACPPPRAQNRKLTKLKRAASGYSERGAHSFAGSFGCRTLLSRHNRNRPDATTTADPITSETVGTSPQTAKPRMLAHMRER